jgi:hypothetical protein
MESGVICFQRGDLRVLLVSTFFKFRGRNHRPGIGSEKSRTDDLRCYELRYFDCCAIKTTNGKRMQYANANAATRFLHRDGLS